MAERRGAPARDGVAFFVGYSEAVGQFVVHAFSSRDDFKPRPVTIGSFPHPRGASGPPKLEMRNARAKLEKEVRPPPASGPAPVIDRPRPYGPVGADRNFVCVPPFLAASLPYLSPGGSGEDHPDVGRGSSPAAGCRPDERTVRGEIQDARLDA